MASRSYPEKRVNKKLKVREIDFEIPNFSDYNSFKNINYPVNFLKEICSNYKLKRSGNKPELYKRIYEFLESSYFSLKIQKIFRGYLVRNEIKLRGPGFKNRNCQNENDFLTFQEIKNLENSIFFSIEENGNIWGFNIISIYNIFLKSPSNNFLNPYTRVPFPLSVINKLDSIIRLCKIKNEPINININNENDDSITQKKKLDFKALELFQYINSLGNYSDYNWYINLSKRNLIRFLRELQDIWMYRAQLSIDIQKQICSPYGNPFRFIDMTKISTFSFIQIFKYGINIIEQFCKKGTTNENCNLGSSYVLCALTLVSYEAACALPWLYDSVANAF